MEKGAKIAAVFSFLALSPAVAQVVYVPCDLPLARAAPVLHLKSHLHHPIHRHHRHRHPVKRGRLGFHLMLRRGMCPVYGGEVLYTVPEELGGPAGEEPGFGGLPFENAGSDLGGEGFGPFGGFGGGEGGFGGSDIPPALILFTAPALTPVEPLVPLTPATPTPVPEPSAFILMLAGLAAIVLKRRACLLR